MHAGTMTRKAQNIILKDPRFPKSSGEKRLNSSQLENGFFCPSRNCSSNPTSEGSMATILSSFHRSHLPPGFRFCGDFIDVWKYEGVGATLLLSLPPSQNLPSLRSVSVEAHAQCVRSLMDGFFKNCFIYLFICTHFLLSCPEVK